MAKNSHPSQTLIPKKDRQEYLYGGKVARIDFTVIEKTDMYSMEAPKKVVVISQYRAKETAYGNVTYYCFDTHENPSVSLDDMIKWCEQNGYHVRKWCPTGARAWLGRKPHPIRDRWQMKRLDERLKQRRDAGTLPEGVQLHTLDLRYDW